MVASFPGPGRKGAFVYIMFPEAVDVEYFSIQIMRDEATFLYINGIKVVSGGKSKSS